LWTELHRDQSAKAIEPFGAHGSKTIYNPEMYFVILPFDALPQAMASLRAAAIFPDFAIDDGECCDRAKAFRHGRAKAQRVARMRAR
jgi:hypothetical protein